MYSPGSPDRSTPARRPSHSGPPWWGQRLRSAKYSPPTLKIPIERPATSTILRLPGGISSARATTTLVGVCAPPSPSGEAIQPGGVVEVDLLLKLGRQRDRE